MPTRMYNYEAPDALDLPWDAEAAALIAGKPGSPLPQVARIIASSAWIGSRNSPTG